MPHSLLQIFYFQIFSLALKECNTVSYFALVHSVACFQSKYDNLIDLFLFSF